MNVVHSLQTQQSGTTFLPPKSCLLVMPQFLQASSLHPSQSQGNCQTTILERLQQWTEEPKRDTITSVDKVVAEQPGTYQRRDTPVPPITAEQHPPFRSRILGFKGRGEPRHAKRLPQRKKNTPCLRFCSVLVVACHGSRLGGSHLLHLDSLGTGLEKGEMSIIAATARNQSNLVPCSPDRPEPFSQKARAGGNWKLQFWL